MIFDSGLSRSVLYDFFLWYCVEGSGEYHEVTYSFAVVADLNPDIPEEVISVPLLNDCDFSGYMIARKSSMANPDHREWVLTYLCKHPRYSSLKESFPDLINIIFHLGRYNCFVVIHPYCVHWGFV